MAPAGGAAGVRAREVVATLAGGVVGAPGALLGQALHPGDVLAAVDVGLDDVDDDPPLDASALRLLAVPRVARGEGFGVEDVRTPVDVQADEVLDEVDHQQADVRVLAEVTEAGHHAVAAVLGVGERAVVEHPQEAGRARPQRGVAVAARVRGGDEDHLHAVDELDHPRQQPVAELVVVEALGAIPGAAGVLQPVLAVRAGPALGATADPDRWRAVATSGAEAALTGKTRRHARTVHQTGRSAEPRRPPIHRTDHPR